MDKKFNNWKKTFYIITVGQAFSLLGSSMVQFAIIWWLTVKTDSAMVLSMASIAGFLPQAILGPFVGTLVDRHSRRFIMIAADLLIAAATLVLIVAFFIGEQSIWLVFLILAIRSLGSAFHMTAMQASIPMIIPEEKLTSTAGITQFIQSAVLVLGPALAALMLGLFSIEYVMMIDVLGAIIASFTLVIVSIPNPERSSGDIQNSGMWKETIYGAKELAKYKGLFWLTIVSSLYMLVYVPVGSLFPLMVRGHFGGEAFHASAVEVAFAAGMLIGSVILTAIGDKFKRITLVGMSILIMGAALILSGLLPTSGFIAFVLLSAMMGFSGPLFSGAYFTLMQSRIDPSILGRVMGVINSMMLIATPLGLLIAGPGAEILGIAKWFMFSGIAIVVLSMITFINKTIHSVEKL